MSTYLLAFAIGHFECVETVKNNVRIRVYATSENINKTEFSLNVASNALDWFEKFFNYKYPINKLDLIGIPDFNSGAMENYGLLTFRETSLLCDDTTELSRKQSICNTVCHEIAHQWFGNAITETTWDDAWLSEGFATFFTLLFIE